MYRIRIPDPNDPKQHAVDERGYKLDGGYWYNAKPTTDIYEALGILAADCTWAGKAMHLHRVRDKPWKFELVVPWYRDGTSGQDSCDEDRFEIDEILALRLIHDRLVEPRRIKKWGSTRTEPDELVITDEGRERLEKYLKDMRADAERLLKPGVHTDLTGKPDYAGYSREDWRTGALYFKFRLPGRKDETCKVYPEQNRLVMPEDKEGDKAA